MIETCSDMAWETAAKQKPFLVLSVRVCVNYMYVMLKIQIQKFDANFT